MVSIIKLKSDGKVDVTAVVNGEEKVVGVADAEPISGGKHIFHVRMFVGNEHLIAKGFKLGELEIQKEAS